ncbi:hypothetical protein AGMMS49936_07660 [Endomicrobiia bacterium]|nr:hypothetical protein AGMMS49936_07660 [Endomicrobiia bacterium]
MKYLILDLRDNPGGLIDSATAIMSMFMKGETLIFSTKGIANESKKEYFTSGNGEFSDLPLIVLVNKDSASTSEILAGAVQDHNRGLIIGCNTFGKGSVMKYVPLLNGAASEWTVAYYYLPSGRPINRFSDNSLKNGITPDVEVKGESGLCVQEHHDKNQNAASVKNKHCRSEVSEEKEVEDIVLSKAIEIIKENKMLKR